ncbi:KilA-N domain-containing protein, partial [Acetobacter pasteurianus]|uniref:KilA-N domain-containing protein n=1 Tax=Acetobacter pasteurianus TaxID=438 RepID=UPI0011CDED30
MNASLSILGTKIRQDAEGRFCLNDCHKAAGGLKKDGPSYFLATGKAQELIRKLASEGHTGKSVSPLNVVNDGINNGTYASKEVIYAYAMWINVDFHLTVIRAFDALVTGQIAAPALSEQEIVAQALQITVRQIEELKAENAILAPKAEVAE